jgi:hypothetical protein
VIKTYGVKLTPTFVLIGKNGIVQARYSGGGMAVREALAFDVRQLLQTGSILPQDDAPRGGYG